MRKNRQAIVAAAAMATLLGSISRAATLNWDADGILPVSGGSGTWDTASPRWEDGAGNYTMWNNGNSDSAVFGGTAGTVTLAESITANTLTFNTSNYVIDLGTNNLTVNGMTALNGTVANLTTITGSAGSNLFVGAAGFPNFSNQHPGPRLSGAMNVTYAGTVGSGVNPPGWYVAHSGHDFSGTLTLIGANAIRSDGTSLGTGQIRLGGTHVLQLGTSGSAVQYRTFANNIELLNATSSIISGGLRTLTLSGTISGTGSFRQGGGANQGAIILTGDNTYSGTTSIIGAGMTLTAGSNNAFGNSALIDVSNASTVGFTGNISVPGTTPVGALARSMALNSSAPGSGLGMLQNFSGDNTYAGAITMGSNTQRVFGAYDGSSLTLTGVISAARGFIKTGAGTIVLTGKNTYGQNTVALQGGTSVNQGVLRLDFSQTEAGHDVDIVNFGVTSNTSSTFLMLGGGTLEIKGKSGATNSQRFKDYSGATANLGFQVNSGGSYVKAVQNGATSLSANFGRIQARQVGGTIDFTLPTTGAFTLPTGSFATGLGGELIRANGAAFATVGGADWAAREVGTTNTIVAGSSITNFYTANTPTGFTPDTHTDMSAGDTTLEADTQVTTLRFNNAAATTITAENVVEGVPTPRTLTTGGILVTPAVGNNLSRITAGTLRGATGTANQDLVIHQYNTANALQIDSVIADNVAATGLTKSGPGKLVLTNANTYTGGTTVNEGVLKLDNANAIPGGLDNVVGTGESALTINGGGIIGLTSDFTRAVGSGAGQVRFLGSGGWAAYGADRTVTLNNVTTGVSWGTANFVPTMSTLMFGAPDSDATLIYANNLNTLTNASSPVVRVIHVQGNAAVDARMTGVVSGEGDVTKTGTGTLEYAGANTYTGNTVIAAGDLLVTGTLTTTPIALANATSVNFDRDSDSSYGGPLSGGAGASVFKNGTGTLSFTGASTFTGATTVNEGILSFGNGGSGGSYAGDILNNTAVQWNRTGTSTYAGNISGPGTLTKLATGTLVLTGNNSHAGGTFFNGGIVEFSGLNNLGSDGLSFGGGTLRYATGNTTDISTRTVTINTGGATINTNGNTTPITYANSIGNGGAGGFTKSGAGTLVLAASTNYAGSTTVTGGTLVLQASNGYAGGTTLTAGTLLVNNTTGSGTGSGIVNVNGGTLGGTGTIGGALALNGAGIAPGDGGAGTLTAGDFTLANGSSFFYDLADETTAGGGINDLLVVNSGAPNVPPVGPESYTLHINALDGTLAAGSYLIIDSVTPLTLDPARFFVGNNNATNAAANTYGFALDPNGDLVLNVTAGPAESVWDKDDSVSLWSDTASWVGGVPNVLGATATFGSKITVGQTVNVDGVQTVGTINFDNNNKYTVAPATVGGGSIVLDAAIGGAVNVISGSHDITAPITLAKNTTFTVTPAASTLTVSNLTAGGVNVAKAGAGTLTVNHLRAADVAVDGGTLKIAQNSGADGVSNIAALTIAAGASLDLTDNKLITTSAAGTATEGVYNGLQGQVQSAFNFGSWNGPGLTTSMQLALDGIATIGVATGEQIRGLGPTDTDVWAGQTINGASTIAMYTYAGDANLDGQVDAGDYGILDAFIQVPGATGYGNGDFNYDGFIDPADYGTIDNSIQFQGPPIFTSGGSSGLAGVTAVPEPASLSVLALATATLLGRRRRRD